MAEKSTTSGRAKKAPTRKQETVKSPAKSAAPTQAPKTELPRAAVIQPTPAAGKPVAAAKPARAKAPSKASAKGTLRVAALMTGMPQICRADDHLAKAAASMWTSDCGSLPVLDHEARLVGWITDRDISMALAMQPVPASSIEIGQVMNGPVHTCAQTAPVSEAMAIMSDKQIRRLAVVDDNQQLVGVLSISDLVRSAKTRGTATAPAIADVFETVRGISRPYEKKDDA
ncbi:MAG: hypothetical protein DHS20C21_13660 [Gemmatimonadota bacterium]|nr:MAG: hypothetical protein DHS20C21_13660 [Gemmatimonadota bacterium]